MANRFWVGDTDGTWNDANNWAATSGAAGGAGVPTSADDVIFDSAYTTQNCTCDVAIDILSIDIQSTYDGTLDFADSAYAHAIGGDATFSGTGTVDLGTSLSTISGTLTAWAQSTWTRGTSTVILDGTSKNLITDNGGNFHNLVIDGTIATVGGFGLIKIYGDLTVNTGDSFTISASSNSGVQHFDGNVANSGDIVLGGVNYTFISDGTITGSNIANITSGSIIFYGSPSISASVFEVPVLFTPPGTDTVTVNGALTFQDDVTFDTTSGALTFDNSGNYDLTFQADVITTIVSALTWTKGTGTITFSGTANQDIDFNGEIVEDIDLDKSAGTVTLTGELITDSFTGTAGTLDIDGNDLSTIANFTAADGTSFLDTAGGGLVTVSGNFALNGSAP